MIDFDNFSGWRKKELGNYLLFIDDLDGDSEAYSVHFKMGIAIAYACFEGFTKEALKTYIEYNILNQPLSKLGETTKRGIHYFYFKAADFNKKFSSYNGWVADLENQQKITSDNKRYIDSFIDTSNINLEVLNHMLALCSIQVTIPITDKPFLDGKLLGNRNKIVHGDNVKVDKALCIEVINKTLELIDKLGDTLKAADQ